MNAIRKFGFLVFAGFLFLNARAQHDKPDKRFSGLDTCFQRILKEWHAAGFAVAVVEKNKLVYSIGVGYKDYENKLPVTTNTLFAIGSCTKAFTASLLGLLNKEEKVDFDKPVHDYLPELKFYNDEMTDHITLRDMMCHRTGLPRHDFSWYFFPSQSRDSLLQRIRYMEPSAGLREKWQYNNFMFMLQGLVVEKITGKTWEENVRQSIFLPLGMNNSDLSIDEMTRSTDVSLGYDVKKDSLIHKTDYYHIEAMAPAGSINSSVSDMSKWVTTWINAGKFNGKEILPAAYIAQALSSQMVVSGSLPDKEKSDIFLSNYGFGWVISSYRGHYRAEHGGNINGFSASTCLFPTDSIGIIVLCNQDASAVPSVVRNIIADRMLNIKYFDWQSDLKRTVDKARIGQQEMQKNKTSSRKKGTQLSHPLKEFEGIYANKGYGSFELTVINDSLFAFSGSHTWWLRNYHYDVFEPFDKDPKDGIDTTEETNLMQFQMNKAGDLEGFAMTVEPTLKPMVFSRTPKPKEMSKDSLQKYTGEYTMGPQVFKVYLKSEKTLMLSVSGQPEYELVPIDKNKFLIKMLSGFTIQFNENEQGQIIELLAIQPNGTFKASRKK
jgi:CubicO group peptidase (beta-lactamase class C family)